jgi:predicted aspartyl protease
MLDTGSSDVSITTDVLSTLRKTGTVGDDDLAGTATYKLADGTLHTYQRVILRQVSVGHQIVKNVIATVMDEYADPLLGQAFLSQLPFYIIDNEKNALVIHDDCNCQNVYPPPEPGREYLQPIPYPKPKCCEWQSR